jgi:alpha-amylase
MLRLHSPRRPPQIEHCRLAGLPDLNQTQDTVSSALNGWVQALVANFSFDGLRVDTVPEVEMPFWRGFEAAAGVYAVGEVYNGDIGYVAPYQGGALSGVLSYPLFFTLRSVFASSQSMYGIQSTVSSYSAFADVDALGTFLDNHDQARFLSVRGDVVAYRAGLLYTLLSTGIPIVYYGTEALFAGGNDPANREPLWPTGFPTNGAMYGFIATVRARGRQRARANFSES